MPEYRKGEIRIIFCDPEISPEEARTIVEEVGIPAVAAKPVIEGRAGHVYKLSVAVDYEDAYVELFARHRAVRKAERFVERGE